MLNLFLRPFQLTCQWPHQNEKGPAASRPSKRSALDYRPCFSRVSNAWATVSIEFALVSERAHLALGSKSSELLGKDASLANAQVS